MQTGVSSSRITVQLPVVQRISAVQKGMARILVLPDTGYPVIYRDIRPDNSIFIPFKTNNSNIFIFVVFAVF